MQTISEQDVWEVLRAIPDPEIPTINIVDLGIIRSVSIGERMLIEIMPTFVGCPALDMMKREIKQQLAPYGDVEVKVVYSDIWTTERITEAGRKMLLDAAIAPPPRQNLITLRVHKHTVAQERSECPHCHSRHTQLENLFGPTPCRAICYCRNCHQPFEQFKAV
jgi:ring-1,2-phenylacetyl-CoA epoxidase subunit PaaD